MEWKTRRARLWRVRVKEDGVEDEEGYAVASEGERGWSGR